MCVEADGCGFTSPLEFQTVNKPVCGNGAWSLCVYSYDNRMRFLDWTVNLFTSRPCGHVEPYNTQYSWYTRHGHGSGGMAHKWFVFIFNTPTPAGCDAFPGIIVNFCLNLVWRVWIKRQRLKQMPGAAFNRAQQTDIECIYFLPAMYIYFSPKSI